MRSHKMAERRALMIVAWVIAETSTRPAPTVFATAVPESAPSIFKSAAIDTATCGERTLVATDVAIAFAVS